MGTKFDVYFYFLLNPKLAIFQICYCEGNLLFFLDQGDVCLVTGPTGLILKMITLVHRQDISLNLHTHYSDSNKLFLNVERLKGKAAKTNVIVFG